ncbi:hypothetical protein BDZ91DRAFT_767151 [Kalaharituber pfeilii]|nr:hypothetical protein BDZ91DRAFT_767151 [Kalaharituber pfeilii]
MRGRGAVRIRDHGRGKLMVDIRGGFQQPREGVASKVSSVNFEPHCSSSLPEPSNEATVIISSPSTTTIDMELALYNTMRKCVRRSAKSTHHYRWAHHYPIGDGTVEEESGLEGRSKSLELNERRPPPRPLDIPVILKCPLPLLVVSRFFNPPTF